MAFKMNGSPMHSGTAAHKSALKMAEKSPAKDKKIIDGTADAPRHNAYLATESHYGDPHGPKPSDKPEEVKEAAESGALKMKSPAKQAEAKIIKTKDNAGAEFVKGGRSKKGVTFEKGKRTTYSKETDGTTSKKVEKIKKGETGEGWKTTKDKTISSKKAARQIKRKTKKAERSGKKADIKSIKNVSKKLIESGKDKKEVKKWKKETIKGTRKDFKKNPERFADR